jgi:hypothetical protein
MHNIKYFSCPRKFIRWFYWKCRSRRFEFGLLAPRSMRVWRGWSVPFEWDETQANRRQFPELEWGKLELVITASGMKLAAATLTRLLIKLLDEKLCKYHIWKAISKLFCRTVCYSVHVPGGVLIKCRSLHSVPESRCHFDGDASPGTAKWVLMEKSEQTLLYIICSLLCILKVSHGINK